MSKNRVFKIILAVVFSIALSMTALFAFGCASETPTYIVTFDSNGGSLVMPQQVESGKTAVNPAAPTKPGYTFEGWYEDKKLETEYDFAKEVTANITVYASWSEIETYTVTFDSAGGSSVSAQTIESGKKVNKPDAPTKEGYKFEYWMTTAGTEYNFDMPVSSGFTLYAYWTKVAAPATYNVTFEMQGHGTAPDAQTVTEGGHATEPETEPSAEGWTFGGWFKEAACTNEFDFETETITKATKVYAKWTQVNPEPETYQVTFEMQGHGTAPAAQTVTEGGHATEPTPEPSETGWTFGGWYKEAACTNEFDFETETITSATKVYAKWTEDGEDGPETYQVTFEMQNHGTAPAAQTVTEGGHATEPETEPSAEGWTFGGWYKEAACTNVFDFETETITKATTIYAKWTQVVDPGEVEEGYYIVTFMSNCDVRVPQQRVESGKKAAKPDAPANSGKVLVGWYENENFTGNAYDFVNTTVTKNITLYAKWENDTTVKTYLVTFNSKGGKFETMDNQEIIQEEINSGSKAVEPTAPVKANSTFAGWYENENCEGTAYSFNTAVTADVTLYAKWTEDEPTTPPTTNPTTKTDNKTYDYSQIAGSPADKEKLTQNNFTGVNEFLKITTGKVTYRNKELSSDGKSPDCIENKDDGIKVIFQGTGSITISFASTGSSNTSSLELRDAAGNALKVNASDSGVYTVTGTTATTVTFNITEAGTYTIYCSYEYSEGTTRGARITAISMTDTYTVENA